MPRISRAKRTAYHEAGHAVIAYLLHRRLRRITIIPDGKVEGWCYLGKGPKIDPYRDRLNRYRNQLERAAMIAWGGSVAEFLLTGEEGSLRFNTLTDTHDVIDSLSDFCTDIDEGGAYASFLWYRTRNLMRQPWSWAAVEALATELLEKKIIGQKRAREIIKQAIKQAVKHEVEVSREECEKWLASMRQKHTRKGEGNA